MKPDVKIVVRLESDRGEEIVRFNASDVLEHNGETRTWAEVGADIKHQYAQESMAEDYALWAFKRRFGDYDDYGVQVLEGLSESEPEQGADGPGAAKSTFGL